ncbi:MAG TPA: wax ester/triacylglycerol synthase family O-acyltransferase, partial [Kribbellaceae bacterium]|nr:wax ester/triacylglycerol synthase family O-acyltransferase [Kribbellaceae bacterium]
ATMIDRASAADLMQQASGHGSAPMQVAGVLVLHGRPSPDEVRAAIADRIRAVPRLRRRLVRAPFGAGRPVWVDDPAFDAAHHVRSVRCPPPGGEMELLAIAAELLTRALPRDRPLWSVTHVDGLAGGRSALVVLFDHVLADGIGGLAVLDRLVDGAPAVPASDFPQPAARRGALVADAFRTRIRAVARFPAALRLVTGAWAELAPAMKTQAPRCSLNRPTGPARRLAVARADLAAVRSVAHVHGGTVNDVVLAAVTGALREVLAGRGEVVDRFVISVPVSPRRRTDAARLGNEVGVLPIELPATGDPWSRLDRVARIVRSRKTAAPGTSSALLAPMIRALAAIGLFDWFVAHQRQINTLVTNVRGPDRPLTFLGVPIADIVPVTTTTGNVTVSFAVFSYAGRLTVTVVADPAACPDLPVLVALLQDELDRLTGAVRETARTLAAPGA